MYIVKKRLEDPKYNGLIVLRDKLLVIDSSKSKTSRLTKPLIAWVSMVALGLTIIIITLYIIPIMNLRAKEKEALVIISETDYLFVQGSLTSVLEENGLYDLHVTNFSDGIVMLSVLNEISLISLITILEDIPGVLGVQYSANGIQIMALWGVL